MSTVPVDQPIRGNAVSNPEANFTEKTEDTASKTPKKEEEHTKNIEPEPAKPLEVKETEKTDSDCEFEDIRPEDVEPEIIDVEEQEILDVEEYEAFESKKSEDPEDSTAKDGEAEIGVEAILKETEDASEETKSETKCEMIPILEKSMKRESLNVAVPRKRPPLSAPSLMQRPLILATHLVPSLPIGLFEVLVEAIEVATDRPVVLLYEPRPDRPVAKEVTDIAVMPASDDWKDGDLLPVTFAFKHRMNKDNSPHVYVDVVIAPDRAPHVEGILDLRGYRCALPDRRKQMGAAGLLFNHLHSRGESPAFFGNTLDADSQIAALQMVAGKQSEIGVLESPVIGCQKNSLPGVESLYTLTSLGPLPPYRIMVNKALSDTLVGKITDYLLNIDQVEEWKERFAPFGVSGFVKNSTEYYDFCDMKSVVTRVPYY